MGLVLRMLVTALALWLAAAIVPGIEVRGVWTLVGAALLLGIANAVVRPLVIILTLPITVLTLGLFLLVINAGMLGLVAWLLDGFRIANFGAALLGAVVVGLVGWGAALLIGPKGRVEMVTVRRRR